MTITPTALTRAAGMCAAAAGAIFIAVQINHPPADVAHLLTTEMVVRESAKAVMAALALVGFTGMYLRQVRRIGVLGLVGFALLSVGYLAIFALQCIVGFVLPSVAASDPVFVQRVLDQAVGGPASGQIGHLHELLLISAIGYALGGLVFGVALFRANVLARWASALLALATVSALALAVLPESFNRPFAVPMGIALIGLGLSLRRSVQDPAAVPAAAFEPAAVR
ncbi:hypothetical protein GA707_12170 [Nostocoides sp. F2B08]|uniref:hypothetical protein n=1 Tax=Nostocoides sp. F2B08 TaxID=2653936 RepID=UPI001262FA99|nr:hypothetical protein [Tetrasphaera sp. F2B08]KAB7744195.1 hypothetical protein GA707_12170 [Tetrasphaera sp. F2B08]